MQYNKITLKIISTILLIFLILIIVIIYRTPSQENELSIYSNVSSPVWVLLIIATIGGIGIIIYDITMKESGNNHWWQIGLLVILIGSLIITLLPYIMGYAFNENSDHLTHLGLVKDILSTDHFSSANVYPLTHIIIAQFSSISGISPEISVNIFGPIFYLLFILFTYILSRVLLTKSAVILATTSSTVLFAYYYNQIFPMGFAFIFFPFIFFLYFRYLDNKSFGFAILMICMIISMIFFHPVAAFVLVIAFLIMQTGKRIYYKFYSYQKRPARLFSSRLPEVDESFIYISFILLLVWIWSHFGVWNASVRSVASWFNSELFVHSMTDMAQENFSKLGLNIVNQLVLFAKLYGPTFVYLMLSLLAIFYVIRNIIKRRDGWDKTKLRNLFIYSCFFLPVVAIWLVDYVRPLTTLSSGRMIWAVIAMFPVFTGLALNTIGGFKRNNDEKFTGSTISNIFKSKFIRVTSIGIIITFCVITAIFSFYPSPYTYRTYWGVSHSSFNGGAWLIEKGDSNDLVFQIGYGMTAERIAHAVWGTQVSEYPQQDKDTHNHFGYDLHEKFGQSINGEEYFALVANSKLLYTELWPQIGRFNLNDFAKLEYDTTVLKIYNDGKAQNYLVHGER